ncbi:MAG: hypothetical protein AB7Q29_15950 [Vicinamibacterales bacterium]
MYIYEAELATPVPDQRLKTHVTAADEDGAREEVFKQFGDRPILSLTVRRELAPWELELRGLKVED